MTIKQFTDKIDGIANDYANLIITPKEFRERILDVMIEVCGKELEKPNPDTDGKKRNKTKKTKITCPICDGSGKRYIYLEGWERCETCNGTGKINP